MPNHSMSLLEREEFWRDRIRRNFVAGDRALILAKRNSLQAKIIAEVFSSTRFIELDGMENAEARVQLQSTSEKFEFVYLDIHSNLSDWFEIAALRIKDEGRLWAQFPRLIWEQLLLSESERNDPTFNRSEEGERADLFFERIGMRDVAFGTAGLLFGDWGGVVLPVTDGSQMELFAYRATDAESMFGRFRDWLGAAEVRLPFFRPVEPSRLISRSKLLSDKPQFRPVRSGEVLLNKSPSRFPTRKFKAYRNWTEKNPTFLSSLVDQVCRGAQSDTERMWRIYELVQDALVRDPISQPLNRDGSLPTPAITLLTQSGRCGHVANLLVELLTIAGIRAKVWQLPQHISVKVSLTGNEWFLLDPDVFKFGVRPTVDGGLITAEQLADHPEVLDRLPATGWFQDDLREFRQPVRGYHEDLALPDRGYTSDYFRKKFASSATRPGPFVPLVSWSKRDLLLSLKWSDQGDRSLGFLFYEVRISSMPRGWSFRNFRKNKIFPQRGLGDILITRSEIGSIEVEVPCGQDLFIEVSSVTKWIEVEPQAYVWPSEELRVRTNS